MPEARSFPLEVRVTPLADFRQRWELWAGAVMVTGMEVDRRQFPDEVDLFQQTLWLALHPGGRARVES